MQHKDQYNSRGEFDLELEGINMKIKSRVEANHLNYKNKFEYVAKPADCKIDTSIKLNRNDWKS